MSLLKNPAWLKQHEYRYEHLSEVPESVFERINTRLAERATDQPVVSIVIPVYNEEVNIIQCISTLSVTNTTVPYEIIAVNNNSTDRTQETLDRLRIRSVFQPIQGCGPARQLGQEAARGEYVLQADADCLYPVGWIDAMLTALRQPGVACVYGRYAYMATSDISRWQLQLIESMRDVIAEYRHLKRPYLNAYGMSMGYVKDKGLAIGFVMHNIRGEDGRMCFDLMQYGRVVQVRARTARVWTGPRSLLRDGTFWQALGIRIRKETGSLLSYLTPHPPHDTKTSKN